MSTSSITRTLQWRFLLAIAVFTTLYPLLAFVVTAAAGRVRVGASGHIDDSRVTDNSLSPPGASPYLLFSSLALLRFGGILPARSAPGEQLVRLAEDYQVRMYYFPYAFGYEWPRSPTWSGAVGTIRASNRMGLFGLGNDINLPEDLVAVGQRMGLRPQDYLCLDEDHVLRWSANASEVRDSAREWSSYHSLTPLDASMGYQASPSEPSDDDVRDAMETEHTWADWVHSVRYSSSAPVCTNTFFTTWWRIPAALKHESIRNSMPILLLLFIEANIFIGLISHFRRDFFAPRYYRGARRHFKTKRQILGVRHCICPFSQNPRRSQQDQCICDPSPLIIDPRKPHSPAAFIRGEFPRRYMNATYFVHVLGTLVILIKAWILKGYLDRLDKTVYMGGLQATWGWGFVLFRFSVIAASQISRACWDKLAAMDKAEYMIWAAENEGREKKRA